MIGELDGVGLLIDAVSKHSKNSKVVKNACLALASLVEIDGMYDGNFCARKWTFE